ncbi:MAG: HAMP domain-containing protein, partial [Nocardioidaceae bacterium]
MRPLDPVRSLKAKLGLLVAATVAAAALLVTAGTGLGLSAWLVVPVAIAVALGLTQVLARGMTSPLREMTAAARAMATGDYSRRVTATSRDEVGELARAFNTMAADLAAVDRQRRDLVANVSHELRTPVSALRALLENLADGVVRPDPDRLRVALAQTERLGRLVADLLDLSRLDAGISRLRLEPVALAPFLQEAVRE